MLALDLQYYTDTVLIAGQVYTAEELRELAEVFRKYKMIVVSDEIYSYLTYDEDFVSLSKVL